MKDKIINWVHQYPKKLILLITSFAMIASLGIINLEVDYNQKSWFRDGDKLIENYESFQSEYGSDTSLILLLSFNSNVFNTNNLKRIQEITERLYTIPNIVRVDSLTNFSHATGSGDEIVIEDFITNSSEVEWTNEYIKDRKEKAQSVEGIEGFLMAKDQQSVAIYNVLKNVEGAEGKVAKEVMQDIEAKIINKFNNHGLEIMITGNGSVGESFKRETLKDMKLIIPIAFILLFIILIFILKNLVATFMSMGLIAITVLTTLGIQGFLNIKLGLVTAMCPIIIMAICIVDLVHIFSSYLNDPIDDRANILTQTLRRNITPTFLTTATTMIGFMSFLTADLVPISDMGLIASIGIALAWTFSIFLICPLLRLIPLEKKFLKETKIQMLSFAKIKSIIVDKPAIVISFFSFLTMGTVSLSSQNVIDSNIQNYFAEDTQIRKATKFFEKHVGGSNSIEVIVKSEKDEGIKDPAFLKKVDAFINDIEKIEGLTKVNSLITSLKQIHQVMNGGGEKNYVIADTQDLIAQELFFLELSLPPTKSISKQFSTDKRDLRLSIYWDKSSSTQIAEGREKIMTTMKQHGLVGHVTGLVPLISGLDGYIVESFIESMVIATAAISIFMMVIFRSFFFGFLCIIPNVIVPSFGAAALFLMGRSFDAGSVLIFSICLGIAIDDTIYLLTNFKRQKKKGVETKVALNYIISHSGTTLFYTTLILVSIFSLFSLGSFVPNQNFAIATTVILSSALILDLMLLPSIIMLISKTPFLAKRLRVH